MGVKFGMDEGIKGPLLHAKYCTNGVKYGTEEVTLNLAPPLDPLLHAKFHRCNDKDIGPRKLKIFAEI